MCIRIKVPGPLTTVQDLGRIGHMHSGFQQSGAMDWYAASLANILCGNDVNSAVLEMTLGGITCRFLEPVAFALCGADMYAVLDGIPVPMQQVVMAPAGSLLKMGMAKTGCRTYMAVSGGLDVPLVMGSRSTNLRCKVGGLAGRGLRAGDVLSVLPGVSFVSGFYAPYKKPVHGETLIRAIPGPQNDYFTKNGMQTFFTAAYAVTPASDRMGMKLSGPAPEAISGTDIISDGIALGSVQIPAGGQPIILLSDRQTVGGYAKIATVIKADLPKLAQLRPGDTIRFIKTDRKEALSALGKMQEYLANIQAQIQTQRKG
ncbi:MAG: biotin-dependent carboxyltransferase family protein [Clostridiales bacterium]|jgi:antagonist of KipI|nr:biotin-dependent carboxyltransferase family protein [Clostridiales bacterium]